jgi:hypothetical protein
MQRALEDALPGYAGRDALGQLGAFTETQDALTVFLGAHLVHETRPTAGEANASLEKLSTALAALAAAWDEADTRARDIVYHALGAGHDSGPSIERRMERARARVQREDQEDEDREDEDREGADDPPPPDDFSAGAHRMIAFRETAREIEKAARVKLDRDPSVAVYEPLIRELGRIYTKYTGLPVTNTRNAGNARDFIAALITCLPEHEGRQTRARSRKGQTTIAHDIKDRRIDLAITRIVRERRRQNISPKRGR